MEELTTTEAAAAKGVSRAAVYQAIKQGRLPARTRRSETGVRVVYRVDRAALDAWTPALSQSDRGKRGGRGNRAASEDSRRALAMELMGSMPAGRFTLDDFLAAKHADTDRER
ncbi:MAG TPA: helix-turn-helix domain-containing protein [Armatimonadota bacterium]|jgi:excisionase family DNA binding protein